MCRGIIEESGVATFETLRHLTTDVWSRRESPPKWYVRSFYHVPVYEPRDRWSYTVAGTGPERGTQLEFFWVNLPTGTTFALDLDDYLPALTGTSIENPGADVEETS